LLARARRGAAVAGRVTRRAADEVVPHRATNWPITVADVLPAQADANDYGDRVTRWARSVCDRLDRDRSPGSG
jgi:hypothetical protein